MKNRIVVSIEKAKKQIADRLSSGKTTTDKLEELRKELDLTMEEYTLFHERKTLAVAHEILTIEEGMTIYNFLGEGGPTRFNSQPVEVKSIITKLMVELRVL